MWDSPAGLDSVLPSLLPLSQPTSRFWKGQGPRELFSLFFLLFPLPIHSHRFSFLHLHPLPPLPSSSSSILPPLLRQTISNNQPLTHTQSHTQCPQQSRLSPVNTVPVAPSARGPTPSSKVYLCFLTLTLLPPSSTPLAALATFSNFHSSH